MKVARFGRVRPVTDASAIFGSTGSGPDGQVLTSIGSNTVSWASNVQMVVADSSNKILGPIVNIASGSNILFTFDSFAGSFASNLRIHSTASSAGGGGGTSSDVVRNQISNGDVIIPFLAADPRIRVASGPDMEFDSTTIGGTALGSPDTINANTTVKSCLYIFKGAASGFNLRGRYWTLSSLSLSLPVTMTVHIAAATVPVTDFMRVGMGFAEATPGKTEGIYLEHNSTRYVSTISSTTPTTGAAYVSQGLAGRHIANPPIWFRVVMASSSDITWWWSTDGIFWVYHGAQNRNPGFTIGSVFVAIDAENALVDTAAAIDYIRFT